MHHLLTTSLILTSLLGSTLAAPWSDKSRTDKSYTKIRRKQINSHARSGEQALNRIFVKYGVPHGSGGSVGATKVFDADGGPNIKAVTDGPSGEIEATGVQGFIEYICPVTIGTAASRERPQVLNLNFDTGSTDTWIFNQDTKDLPNNAEQKQRTNFNRYKSKTFLPAKGYTFSTYYGDDSQSNGYVGLDTINVGGLVVTNQAIGLATKVTQGFIDDTDADGILGLGFFNNSKILPKKQNGFWDNIKEALQTDVFTAALKKNEPGNYQFGFIDTTAYKGDLFYTPVHAKDGTWAFDTKPGSSRGIADTGSSLLVLDQDIVDGYWKKLTSKGAKENSQGWTFPCKIAGELPDFKIELGDKYIASVDGELLNYAKVPKTNGVTCFGGLQSNNGAGINIFGDILFQSQFVVFDHANSRIGFAPHA